jgi:hypothetical protein
MNERMPYEAVVRRVALMAAPNRFATDVERLAVEQIIGDLDDYRLLANGCKYHPGYRAKRKVVTYCEPCNAMWDARQRLEGKVT